jgi:hypothetical protein
VAAARAEIEGRHACDSGEFRETDRLRPAGFAELAGFTTSLGRGNVRQRKGLRADSRQSQESQHPPTASAPPLDPEGLPYTACPACGNGLFWKDALPPEGPDRACEACHPPPADPWRHACAVPVTGGTP